MAVIPKIKLSLEGLKNGKTFLFFFIVFYIIFVYFWTKLIIPQLMEEKVDQKIEEYKIPITVNVSNDPVRQYHMARAKVLQRSDLPWIRVQNNIPHLNIPLFDTLRENCKTVGNKRSPDEIMFSK
ncbi:unnamed protein product [Nezara viridula]|uniref:Uncharacterized protein n=1 Tax=Nezara viridula TaxID=85310 RepID=A0A9P0E5A5_NEZVI|nr:unnamed protein product [Nezara viridula]